MNVKTVAFVALGLVGAHTLWVHFTRPKVVTQPLGGTDAPRVTNDVDVRPMLATDLIGGHPYGYTGDGAIGDTQASIGNVPDTKLYLLH